MATVSDPETNGETAYQHPVSRAMSNPTDSNIKNLNSNEKVYVLCHLSGVAKPDVHPDDYTSGVTTDILDGVIRSLRE